MQARHHFNSLGSQTLIGRQDQINSRDDEHILAIKKKTEEGGSNEFHVKNDGTLWYKNRLCVPNDINIKKEIIGEANTTGYNDHSESTKMYQELKIIFLWENIRRELDPFMFEYMTYQRLKIKYERPRGLLQSLPILE